MAVMVHLRIYSIDVLCCIILATSIISLAEDHLDGSHHPSMRLDKNMVQDKEVTTNILEKLTTGIEVDSFFHDRITELKGGDEHVQLIKEEELIKLIDGVLHDDDKNNDGYIDYAEFAKSME
ncbi:putative Multiple coagulation factor deficiency protein [Naja naja]|nr:putative Multiple coagulation factor deficiency protein [Naja naja]